MKNIMGAFDSYLIGKVKIQRWENEFMLRWYKPMFDLMMQATLQAARNHPNIDKQKLESKLSPQALRKFRGE
jgi:hypothetical protein